MAVDWGGIAAAAGPIIAAYAANKSKGRGEEAVINQRQDVNALSGYATDKNADLEALVAKYEAALKQSQGMLDEREAALKEPGMRASNSVRGDMLANLKDATVSAPPGVNVTSFGGGLRPSVLSDNSRALGQQMSKQALLDAMDPASTPKPFAGMSPLDVSSITGRRAPTPTELPQPSGFDRAMEQIGLWGSLAGGLGTAIQQNPYQEIRGPNTTAAGTLSRG
jgi:hypothetical protein